jgi:poly(beta-D-mannuronate) lyase
MAECSLARGMKNLVLKFSAGALASAFFLSPAFAQMSNPGFESGFEGWDVGGAEGAVALSGEGKTGEHSAKLTAETGLIKQVVSLEPGHHYQLSTQLRGSVLLGVKTNGRLYFDRLKNKRKWSAATLNFNSGQSTTATVFVSYNGKTGRLDDFDLKDKGIQGDQKLSHFVLSKTSGGTGLSPTLPPSENFDLSNWYLSIPVDEDKNGKSDSIYEAALTAGFEDKRFFYTGQDGGMVFRATVSGAKTSKNTSYTRSELREMLRAGDTSVSTSKPGLNNWVIASASDAAKAKAGAVGGTLGATLMVDHVTTTGVSNEVGRVIIGQIHGWKNEPIRLYYRRLPGHEKGSIYFAHERQGAEGKKIKDNYYDLIGSRASNASDPTNGISLGEKFSYRIEVTGTILTVSILQDGQLRAEKALDIRESGYEIDKEYLYFKAGVYIQDKTGEPDDYAQATFYALDVKH